MASTNRISFTYLYTNYPDGFRALNRRLMPRIGTCFIDGFEDYEAKLIDHLEKEHAVENRQLSVDGWREWLIRNVKVEERILPPGANPWIRRQYSSKIQTGIGAVEPESLR